MPGEAGTAYQALNSYGSLIAAGSRSDNEVWPKGFLNILVFDKDFTLVDFAYQQLDAAYVQSGETKAPHQLLTAESIIRHPGYVYVFLSNEGANELQIGFDDYSLTHAHSNVIQESSYYPFGLTFADYQKQGSLKQNWKFQDQEHIDDLGLGWVQFKWRNGMPDLGRFFNVDPLADQYVHNSTYAFSENKVTSHVELEGLESYSAQQAFNNEVKKVENVVMPVVNGAIKGVQSVVGAIGDGISSVWNSIGPGDTGGGFTLNSENGGVTGGTDQGVREGQGDGMLEVGHLLTPDTRSDAINLVQGVEEETHVIENTVNPDTEKNDKVELDTVHTTGNVDKDGNTYNSYYVIQNKKDTVDERHYTDDPKKRN